MVICTAAKRIKAPVPAAKLVYAKENVAAYKKSAAGEAHRRWKPPTRQFAGSGR